MIEKSFLNIWSVDEKLIKGLSSLYQSEEKCKELINKVFSIPDDKIFNARVLIKPNWVLEPRREYDALCLTTHPTFILAALEIILQKSPKSIVIGDAPVQTCLWDKLVDADFLQRINRLSAKYSVPIIVKDFRRTIRDKKRNKVITSFIPLSEYTIFDLGVTSYLEAVSGRYSSFRVTDYDPDKLASTHSAGTHKYCISNELFEADIVISMPKVKTHQKAGLTAALKNLVGLNGDKDFLPHHRIGGTGFGGDCYPGKNYIRRSAECLLDYSNKAIGKNRYFLYKYFSAFLWRISRPGPMHTREAGWYGNDTTWRMVLDLNTIAIFGKSDGSIAKTPVREIYSLCDGIIGGQGNGPLKPDPLPLGLVSFSNNSALTDYAMAILMGFDIDKLPLIKNAVNTMLHSDYDVLYNGLPKTINDLFELKTETNPPPGWVGHIEK